MPAIPSFLEKLNPWHEKDVPPPPPPITVRTAVILLIVYALAYFVPFYLSRQTRPSPTLPRDAPSVIRARVRSVVVACAACCAATFVVLTRAGRESPLSAAEALHLMGLWPLAPLAALRALLLTALLFLGPLFAYLVADGGWREWVRLEPLREVWGEWVAWRNIVAGPVTEEILFRTASIPLLLVAQSPARQIVLAVPLVFGLAHCHHFYEFRLSHPHVPVSAAALRSVLQLAYTTLFGAYAAFVFLRSGSLLAACLAHAFCNAMGLPQLWGRVRPSSLYSPSSSLSSSAASLPGRGGGGGGGGGGGDDDSAKGDGSLLWTVAYYALLVAGAVGWYRNLWALTESTNALVPATAFSRS